MYFQGKNVLVVGASGALGALLSQELASAGAVVSGTARTATSAASIPAVVNNRLLLDLESQSSIDALLNHLKDEICHGVINASGIVGFGKANETTAADANRLMQVNHLGPAALIAGLYLPLKAAEGSFVASITGVVAERTFQGMSAYCASKTAHSAFLSTIAQEWRRDKIQVTDARPGHTETGLASRAIFGSAPAFPEGMTANHVVGVFLNGISSGQQIIASSEF
jgi:cyclic-di-GMP-binding biofilm dispersal mediator protein